MRIENLKFEESLRRYSAVLVLLVFVLINSVATPNFFQLSNLNNIIMQICPIILCSMGMTLVISTGGIDISVGSLMAISGVICALTMTGLGIFTGIIIGLLVGSVCGLLNGFFVGTLRLQAMVITLGMQLGIRGLAQVLCGGRDIYFNKLGLIGKEFAVIGNYKLLGFIPIQIVPIIFVSFFVWILVEKMVIGKQIQAVGDNLRSSVLTGINANKIYFFVYGLSGFFAALAGVFQSARIQVAAGSSLGQLAELDAIAAVVIGGTPMAGGKAHVGGTIIGALIMQMITLTCVMNNVPDEYAQVFKALIIVFAVYIQRSK